ncbi:unnamed protein product, partial [Ectocarpus sp. 13 AM-2016]
MHSSDSFSNGVQPYLEAYASRRSYSPIGDEKEDGRRRTRDGGAAELEGRQELGWRRAGGVVAIIGLFCAAVSASRSRWFAAGGTTSATDQPLQDGGSSYHGMFDAFQKRIPHGWTVRAWIDLAITIGSLSGSPVMELSDLNARVWTRAHSWLVTHVRSPPFG